MDSPPELKGSYPLEVLTLEVKGSACHLVDGARLQHRRTVDIRLDERIALRQQFFAGLLIKGMTHTQKLDHPAGKQNIQAYSKTTIC